MTWKELKEKWLSNGTYNDAYVLLETIYFHLLSSDENSFFELCKTDYPFQLHTEKKKTRKKKKLFSTTKKQVGNCLFLN